MVKYFGRYQHRKKIAFVMQTLSVTADRSHLAVQLLISIVVVTSRNKYRFAWMLPSTLETLSCSIYNFCLWKSIWVLFCFYLFRYTDVIFLYTWTSMYEGYCRIFKVPRLNKLFYVIRVHRHKSVHCRCSPYNNETIELFSRCTFLLFILVLFRQKVSYWCFLTVTVFLWHVLCHKC